MSAPASILPGIHLLDTMMGGRERTNSAYLVAAREPALVETGPTASLGHVIDGLEALGVTSDELAHVVVTHVHLDHAGGVGTLATRFPKATIWVHERGARHLADPGRLVASANLAFGPEHMREVFGPVDPVPEGRIRPLGDGQRIDLGDRTLAARHAPGHANHHAFIVDSATNALWTGDGLGVFLPDVGVLRPATPPPDFDLEKALKSIELVAEQDPPVLLFSHFGPASNVQEICQLAAERLRRWGELVRGAMASSDDREAVAAILEAQTREDAPALEDPAHRERYDLLLDQRLNAVGLMRYFSQQDRGREGD